MFVSAACPRVWVWTSYVFFSPVKIQKSPTKPSSAALFSCCVFYHEDFILLSVSDILHFTRTWYNGLFSLIFFCFQVWVLIGFWEWRGEEGKKQIAVQMQSQISEKNFRLLVFCGCGFSFGLLVVLYGSMNLNAIKLFLWSKNSKSVFICWEDRDEYDDLDFSINKLLVEYCPGWNGQSSGWLLE